MTDATISALATTTATEGGYAVASYSLSSALGIATTVRVTVSGLGGATGADYRASSFQYSMGNLIGDWQTATSGGLITLNAGFTDFQLRVLVENDTISEANEALAFSVAQTTASVGLADSWWVPFTANLADPAGQGAAANLRAITAVSSATPVNEPSAPGSDTNHAAIATYNVNPYSGTGSNSASEIRVSYYGLGGATLADYGGLAWRIGTTGGWTDIANNGLMTIPANASTFQLSANVLWDGIIESNEAISFNVAQTSSSIGLVDSWWVPNTVNLADNGAPANLRTITAVANPPVASEATSAAPNTNAIATYNVTNFSGTGSNGISEVRVSYYGLGGATGADYNTLAYNIGAGWVTIANHGLMTIPANATTFQLSANVLQDTLSESGEAISFNVAQTTASIGLVDSWWVPSTVNLADPAGQGATANLRIIDAASTTTAIEASSSGNNTNHAAVATYNLTNYSGNGQVANNAASVVQVSYYGLGGATGADYNGFAWRIGTADAWTTVANNGPMTIPATANSFQLSVNVLWDGLSESGEAITFNVARTTATVGLADSWSVPSTVNMADSDPTNHVFTSVTGRDHFFGTAFADIFVIPTGTSVANNGGTTGVFAGDSNPNFFGTDYDTITGFAQTIDTIDLPVTVGTVTARGSVAGVTTEELLIDRLANPSSVLMPHAGFFTNAGPNSDAVVYTILGNSYLLVDSARNGNWDPSSDVLIKFIGMPTLTTTDFI